MRVKKTCQNPVENKICSKCRIEKNIWKNFRYRKDRDQYHSVCTECLLLPRKTKEYKQKNGVYIKERTKKASAESLYKIKLTKQKRAKNNPDYRHKIKKNDSMIFMERCSKRFHIAKKKFWAISDKTIRKETFRELMEKQKWRCAISRQRLVDDNGGPLYEIDHIIPFSQWWIHTKDNIQLLLPWVHRIKSNRETRKNAINKKNPSNQQINQ